MEQKQQLPTFKPGSKKRAVMTSELADKLSSKHDYIKYFKEACKFYPTFNPELCSVAVRASQHHAEQGLLARGFHRKERPPKTV